MKSGSRVFRISRKRSANTPDTAGKRAAQVARRTGAHVHWPVKAEVAAAVRKDLLLYDPPSTDKVKKQKSCSSIRRKELLNSVAQFRISLLMLT